MIYCISVVEVKAEPEVWQWETIWVALGAISTVVLTGATIALGWFTYKLWKETKRAVGDTSTGLNYAKISADAAQEQARLTERLIIYNNRPYLFIKPDLTPNGLTPLDLNIRPRFVFNVVNHGNSIGIAKKGYAAIIVVGGNFHIKEMKEEVITEATTAEFFIEVSPVFGAYSTYLALEQWSSPIFQEVRAGTATIYAVGRFVYEGLLGYQHETRFCWVYRPAFDQFQEDHSKPEMNRRT